MDVNIIEHLITALGFPIVCVIGLGFFIWHIWKQMSTQNEKREEKLYNVIFEAQAQNQKLNETNAKFAEILNSYSNDIAEIKTDVIEIKNKIEER